MGPLMLQMINSTYMVAPTMQYPFSSDHLVSLQLNFLYVPTSPLTYLAHISNHLSGLGNWDSSFYHTHSHGQHRGVGGPFVFLTNREWGANQAGHTAPVQMRPSCLSQSLSSQSQSSPEMYHSSAEQMHFPQWQEPEITKGIITKGLWLE